MGRRVRLCAAARPHANEAGMTLATVSRRVVYPLQERLLKRPTFPYLESLERSQWLPRDEIEALQTDKLAALLRIAADYCPWHAERIASATIDLRRCTL